MRTFIYFIFLYVCQVNGTCYVSNQNCTKTKIKTSNLLTNSILQTRRSQTGLSQRRYFRQQENCEVTCVENENCDYITRHMDEKDERNVILRAIPTPFPYKHVFFNATLLRQDWRMFKVRMLRNQEPTVSICRKYTRRDYSNTTFSFQIKLPEEDLYSKFVNQEVHFDYEIHSSGWASYGKISFLVPSYPGLVAPILNDQELFNYVDSTDRDKLTLTMQVPPKSMYNTSKFDIEIWSHRDRMVANDSVKAVTDKIVYIYNTKNKYGEYFFKLTPNSEECTKYGCRQVTSVIVYLDSDNTLYYAFGASVLVAVIAIMWILCCCRKGLRNT